MQKKYKIPVILYETEEQALPYIEVEKDDDMPPVLFIQEYKHTGEIEPDDQGNEQPIVDMTVHMYADMEFLSNKLTPEMYDDVRVAMGLKPLQQAREEGQKVLDKVYSNVNQRVEEARSEQGKAKEELARKLNERLTNRFYKAEEEEEPKQNDKFKLQFEVVDEENEEQK